MQEQKSYFDGSGLDYIILQIVNFFIITFTLGIAAPYAICRLHKWKASHTVIDGRRLKFTGTAGSLFLHWIKWFVLLIITFGIYGFWLYVAVEKWIAERTEFDS